MLATLRGVNDKLSLSRRMQEPEEPVQSFSELILANLPVCLADLCRHIFVSNQ